MTNIDNFKSFVKKNPNLISYVRNGNMTWQKFYEIYDIYGEKSDIWDEYTRENTINKIPSVKKTDTTSGINFNNVINMIRNLDTDKVQEGITSMQKAISLFGDILVRDKTDSSSTYQPRPVYRRFDD